jgi:hypothetical protein
MKKAGLNIAFVLIIFLVIMPAIQLIFQPFKEKPLNGAFNLTEKPSLTIDKWNSGDFQRQAESYLKDNSGFRNFMVRLQNQLDFTFFRQANAEGAVIGKNKQLYEYDYIRSWLAIDYPGDSFIEKKLQRTKYVQEYLKREKGIDLVVVFEPGKASFYPEYLPSKYTRKKNGPSTYDRYRQKALELNIDFIDLHQYFLQLKTNSEYPLYPRYGTHWSIYGMRFAADSLLNLVESRRGITLTEARADSMNISSDPWDTDDDVLKTMNLLFPPKGEKLAYPVYSFDTAHPGKKPMVLVIADSYYWNIFNTRIPKYIFANEAFWYFNTLVYPDHYLKPTYTKDLNFQQEVEKQQVIFLMITERFVHKFDWRFIDQLYALYTPGWLKDPVYNKINDIMQVEPWYENIITSAGEKHISLEEALILNGKYVYHYNDTAGYLINFGQEHFRYTIADDPAWMEQIREKAKQRNISTDEMLHEDALYIFKKDFPGLFELNQGLSEMEKSINTDIKLLDSLRLEASSYRFDPATFIRIKAWQFYKEKEIQKTCNAIRSDPSWLEDVRKKALLKETSLDEMILLDAAYMWEERMKKF